MIDWTNLRLQRIGAHALSVLPPQIKLPVLPSVVTRFLQLTEDAAPEELGRLIERDAGLTAELLKRVNSSVEDPTCKSASAREAISRLGVTATREFLLSTVRQRAIKKRESKLLNIDCFWATNLERALLAREVARLLGVDAELAFTAGMLQDLLLPALTNELFPVYYAFTTEQEPINLVAYERKTFQWDHAEVSAHLMLNWGFPDDLICCVLLHHDGLKLLADKQLGRSPAGAVAVSALIPDSFRQVSNGMQQLLKLEQLWPEFELLEIAERVDEQFQAAALGPANPFTFLRRCQKALASTR